MRIVSLNAWGGALFDELGAWLPRAGAGVLCLQETTRTDGVSGWTSFVDGARTLPQRADLFADVRTLLPGHRAFFDASDAGPVALDDGRVARQEFGLSTYIDRRHPVEHHGAEFVHGGFAEHDVWPTDGRPRIAQVTRVGAAGRTVAVVNVHGLRIGSGKHDTPDRLAQARRLGALVADVSGRCDVTVVCGDLNVRPDSATFAILAAVGMSDLVGDADTRTSRYAKPLRSASYLLVSDRAAVERFEVVSEPEVSDHRALVLDL